MPFHSIPLDPGNYRFQRLEYSNRQNINIGGYRNYLALKFDMIHFKLHLRATFVYITEENN